MLGEYQLEDQSTPGEPILLTKGDVVISEGGTVMKVSTPSMARGGDYDSDKILLYSIKISIRRYLHASSFGPHGCPVLVGPGSKALQGWHFSSTVLFLFVFFLFYIRMPECTTIYVKFK
jgi:hypothetical protein